jgi:hypothetical protein
MNIEYEITKIKNQLQNLQDIVLQMSRNSVPTTSKVDDTANQVKAITPYTETKTAYIGDTNCGFNTPTDGNVSVFFDKNVNGYRVEKDYYARRIVVVFDEPLEEVTEVTISIS